MAIGSGGSPYVHSNEQHFQENIGADIDYNNIGGDNGILATYDINSAIQTLQSISNTLKAEADSFLMGMNVNAELLKNPTTYAGIATKIIQNTDYARLLTTTGALVSKEKTMEMLGQNLNKNEEKILKKIIEQVNLSDDNITLNKMASIIAQGFSNAHGTITVNGTKLQHFFNVDENQLKEIAGDHIYKRLKSKSGTIQKIIKDLLNNSNVISQEKGNISDAIEKFMAKFRTDFKQAVGNEIHFYNETDSPDQYLNRLEQELRSLLTSDLSTIYNASGALNEEVLVAIYKADTATVFQLETVGKMNEKDIEKNFSNLRKMNTHHTYESSQSQTDVLITNVKTGKTVRAQSKTSIRDAYTINNEETLRILNHLQRTVNFYNLLQNLNQAGWDINNIYQICYVVANALWFNTHISVSGKREEGKLDLKPARGSKNTNILPKVIEAINIELSKRIPSFLGISINKTAEEIKADAAASNIFYIENGNLVPTYLQLNEIIKDLQAYQLGIDSERISKSMKFTLEKGVNWYNSNAVSFWKEKYGGGGFDPIPGIKQGKAAISSLSIHGNFSGILQYSSYVVGM